MGVEAFRRRESGDGDKLSYFFTALADSLTIEELQQLCGIVSAELETTESDTAILTAIQVLPRDLWPQYSELARRRVEDRLIESVARGAYDPVRGKCLSGGLGAWASGLIEHFSLKDKLGAVLSVNLASEDRLKRAYVLQYFFGRLPRIQLEPSALVRRTVADALKAGDQTFYDALGWLRAPETPQGWKDAFSSAYESFLPPPGPITDDDVPF